MSDVEIMYSSSEAARQGDNVEDILQKRKQANEKVEEELLRVKDLLERVLQSLEQKEN